MNINHWTMGAIWSDNPHWKFHNLAIWSPGATKHGNGQIPYLFRIFLVTSPLLSDCPMVSHEFHWISDFFASIFPPDSPNEAAVFWGFLTILTSALWRYYTADPIASRLGSGDFLDFSIDPDQRYPKSWRGSWNIPWKIPSVADHWGLLLMVFMVLGNHHLRGKKMEKE